MTQRIGFPLALVALSLLVGATAASSATISQWNFPTVTAAPDNSPAPDIGSGVATVLGMANNYTFSGNNTITGSGTFTFTGPFTVGSVASADVLATPGDPNGFANAWRVRGPSAALGGASGTGNGWALQAPQYTQGVQFSSSTAGYNSINFHFDWFTTTQGVLNMQEQYTLDGTNWININAPLTAVSNGWTSTQTINFSGIAGANNDPNFGVRLVSVYNNALSFPNYGSADGGQGGYYNNNSGNWRFADVGFSGTAISAAPEPSSFVLSLVGGLAGLIFWRRSGR